MIDKAEYLKDGEIHESQFPGVEPTLEPPRNLTIQIGEDTGHLQIDLIEKKTLRNRFKWWLLCRLLPFRIKEWKEDPQ